MKKKTEDEIEKDIEIYFNKIQDTKDSTNRKFLGVSTWRIFAYLVIYSFLGYVVEVLYGLVTKGVIESRQSFIYGPFCAIYGVGAIAMILPLKKINTKNKIINFIIAGLIGSVVEYVVSWFGETFLHVKWWDYSNYFLNINGRICLYFGIFWGILGLWLITSLNPRVDGFIDKVKKQISKNKLRFLIVISNIALLIDCIATVVATDFYQTRVIVENNIDVANKQYYIAHYNNVYSDERIKNRILSTWGNETMVKTFPNLKITDRYGNIIYLNSYYPQIQNYYFKVFDAEKNGIVSE